MKKGFLDTSYVEGEQTTVLDEIVNKIKSETLNPSIEQFEDIFTKTLSDPVLKDILGEIEGDLAIKKKKLVYAKIVLSTEIYNEIGEEFIMAPDMTLEKINVIGVDLPLSLVKAITGKWLAHLGMTADKITNLGYNATADIVDIIGAENIVKMNEKRLNRSITEDPTIKRAVLSKAYEWVKEEFSEGLIQNDTGVNVKIQDHEFEIHILEINHDSICLGLFLPEQIYSRRTISLTNQGYTVQILKPATREGIEEVGSLELEPNGWRDSRMYIPKFDSISNEPNVPMKDRDRAIFIMEKLREQFSK